MYAAHESLPEEPAPQHYLAALNRFWEAAGAATHTQLRLARTAEHHAGRLAIPKEETVVPQVAENLAAARDYVEWLAGRLGLAVFVTVDQQTMLVRGFGFDEESMEYSAIAGPAHMPRGPHTQVPLTGSYPLSIDALPQPFAAPAGLGRAT